MHPKSTWLTNLFGMFKKNVCCLSKLTKRCGTQTGGVAKQQAQNKLTFFLCVKFLLLKQHTFVCTRVLTQQNFHVSFSLSTLNKKKQVDSLPFR